MGIFSRINKGLKKTRENMSGAIDSMLHGKTEIDDDFYDELEEILVMGDVGCMTASEIVEKLRERVLESYKRLPNGANAAFYEQEAMSFPNVAAAKAVGRARGIGTVDVYVSTHAGAPDEKLLGEIEAVLQKKREIAVDVEVKAPTEKTVNMSAELTAEQGWTMQEITDAATAALQAYFTGERLGEAVYTAKLASILYGVEGVKNCHLLTPDEDVSVSATELPVLGTVTITEIGAGEA